MTDLAIDILTANPNSRVVIALPDDPEAGFAAESVLGFTRGDFQFNISNEFNNPEINSGQQSLTNAVNSVKRFLNDWFNTQAAQERIQHPGQTINSWIGSNRPVFSIPLMFIAIRPGDDVRDQVKALARGVSSTAVGSGISQRFRAPLGYAPAFGEATAVGTIAVEIGQWFRATELVMKDSSFNISTITTDSGHPAWAEGTVTLEPFRAVTIRDVRGYFRTL